MSQYTKEEADKLGIGSIYDAIESSPIDDALKSKALAPIFADARKAARKADAARIEAQASEARTWADAVLTATRTAATETGRDLTDEEGKLIGRFLRNSYLGIKPSAKGERKAGCRGPRSTDTVGTFTLPKGRTVTVGAGESLWSKVSALATAEGRSENTAKMWMHNRSKVS